MRLTIARKIALAVIAIVITCVGTMAYVTSANLKRGFVDYLNHIQTQDLEKFAARLAERYQQEGDFAWLRHNRRAMRDVLEQMTLQLQAPDNRPPPPPPRDEQYGGQRPRRGDGARPPRLDDAPPPRPDEGQPSPEAGRLSRSTYGRPARPLDGRSQDGRPPRPDDDRPPRQDDGRPPPEEDNGPPGAEGPRQAPPRDPMGFASRISILDAAGRVVLGPPKPPPGIERDIVVDGKVVGRVSLAPIREALGSDDNAGTFVREQLRSTVWLAAGLIALSVLLAVWLARHLLRPVAALRGVTERLARGEFDARAPLLSRDELAELALHVNAMAQSLEQSEQQRRKMLADVSHELRTPLTVIRGEIEALIDGIREADGKALESLHAEVLHLTKLVEDLHQLNLADAGHLQFDMQRFDLAAHLLPVLERQKPRAGAAGLSLEWILPQQPVEVNADASRITQVLVNLLENSIRYTDKGGLVTVALARQGGFAELTVDDSAPGVPDGVHARLFERLYRVDVARTRKSGGSGLGLSICKAIIEGHGGSIVALPSQLGGVRIFIRLPLAT